MINWSFSVLVIDAGIMPVTVKQLNVYPIKVNCCATWHLLSTCVYAARSVALTPHLIPFVAGCVLRGASLSLWSLQHALAQVGAFHIALCAVLFGAACLIIVQAAAARIVAVPLSTVLQLIAEDASPDTPDNRQVQGRVGLRPMPATCSSMIFIPKSLDITACSNQDIQSDQYLFRVSRV